MTPGLTRLFIARPIRPGSSKTNFAGGCVPVLVRIGQCRLYKLKTGWTEIRSMCAS